MKFLVNWTIDLTKLPTYRKFSGEFYEELDQQLSLQLSQKKKDYHKDTLKAKKLLKETQASKIRYKKVSFITDANNLFMEQIQLAMFSLNDLFMEQLSLLLLLWLFSIFRTRVRGKPIVICHMQLQQYSI